MLLAADAADARRGPFQSLKNSSTSSPVGLAVPASITLLMRSRRRLRSAGARNWIGSKLLRQFH